MTGKVALRHATSQHGTSSPSFFPRFRRLPTAGRTAAVAQWQPIDAASWHGLVGWTLLSVLGDHKDGQECPSYEAARPRMTRNDALQYAMSQHGTSRPAFFPVSTVYQRPAVLPPSSYGTKDMAYSATLARRQGRPVCL